MMTGDSRPVAEAVASELGIDHIFAEVLPEARIRRLQNYKNKGNRWRWSVMGSTMRLPSHVPMWASPSVAAQMVSLNRLAAGILVPWNILFSPAVGALLMSLSTIIFAINAQLLRRVNLSQ